MFGCLKANGLYQKLYLRKQLLVREEITNLAQIFVSHSQKDKELKSFFSEAFATTNVKAIYEEFEQILKGKVTAEQISRDIENSRAIFVVLSQNVQNIPHTRDWVVWEAGVGKNRDIWVFEHYQDVGKISVVTPYLRHYVIFGTSDSWAGYLRKIIKSYDDSNTLGTVLVTGGLGAVVGSALSEDKEAGAVFGGIGGAILGAAIADKSKIRPVGQRIQCANCTSTYSAHLPQGTQKIRCPVCNKFLEIEASFLARTR